jgi:tryptophan 2,3-dioxygenase
MFSTSGGCPFAGGSKLSTPPPPIFASDYDANDAPLPSPASPSPKVNLNGVYYHTYLQLDKVLDAQYPQSDAHGAPAHDEMLFIVMHQTHELWFKQILFELSSCQKLFIQETLPDKDLLVIVTRLKRVTEIMRVLISQLRVLESMTPMDFLDFRNFLTPASGFQSVQFRVLENVLGMKLDNRINYKRSNYTAFLKEEHQQVVMKSEQEPSLLQLVDSWLSRTPFLQLEGFDFWKSYQESAEGLFDDEKKQIEKDFAGSKDEMAERLENLRISRDSFDSIFDPARHESLVHAGKRRMSHKAWKSALFINLYRHLPVLQMPFQILNLLVDIDELMTSWRVAHSLMVHRTLGMKSGTGGSSGYEYLKATSTLHKCFPDLFNLSEYLLPKSKLPTLPPKLAAQMGSL